MKTTITKSKYQITITKDEYLSLKNLLFEVMKRDLLEKEIGVDANFNGPRIKNDMIGFILRNTDQINNLLK
jgi:hypothetical protein